MKEKQCIRIDQYDVHDAKIIYNIIQHSKWNRKHHLYLLCKCTKGSAVRNFKNHKCRWISDNDQLKYYDKSATRFGVKYNQDFS